MDTIKITKDKAMYAFCASTCDYLKAIDCVYKGFPPCCKARAFLMRLYENREKED